MKKLLLAFLIGCSSDVSIIQRPDEKVQDSGTDVVVDATDSAQQDDSTNNQSDTNSQNPDHDLVVGFVEYSFVQASCPVCFGLASEITTTQFARFHEPTGANHYAWVPREDETCRQYYDAPVNSLNVDVGNNVILVAGSFNLPMNKSYDNTGVIYSGMVQNTDSGYVRDAFYNIQVDGVSVTDDQLQSLHGFDYIEPYTMLYTDPSYAYQAPISKTSNSFSWGQYGDSSSFMTVQISVYSWDGASYYGTVICRGPDTGQMIVPGSWFTSYPSGSLTSIHFIRHRTKEVYSDSLQGIIQTHVWWEVIGTGYIQ